MEPYVADPDIGYIALRHRATGLVVVLTAPDGALSGTLAVGQGRWRSVKPRVPVKRMRGRSTTWRSLYPTARR